MTGRVYREFQRDRVGWFFGLTGWQLGLLAGGALPVFWAVRVEWWAAAFTSLAGWLGLLVLVVVPVRGRSATGWLLASLGFALARVTGRDRWSSRLATGRPHTDGLDDTAARDAWGRAERPDLPPALDGLVVHHTAVRGQTAGLAVVQHGRRAGRSWVVVARLEHRGLDWLTPVERDQHGAGLAAMLDAACRTELVSEVQVLVRTSPDGGADREHWLAEHRDPTRTAATSTAVGLARTVHDDLRRHLTPASTRTETFLSLVVPDARLRRHARQVGQRWSRGAGRDEAMLGLLAALAMEVGDHARAHLGLDRVDWLTPSALAEVVRAGFHPDVDTALADARATARALHGHAGDGRSCSAAGVGVDAGVASPLVGVEVGVPWAVAGPAHAQARPRSYVHDGWESASVAVLLPARGAPLGALAPVLSGGGVGERRCLLVGFPVVVATVADRVTASREWGADLGDGLRARAGVRPRAKARADQATARGVDAKLVAGAALTRPYAVATTTVPATRVPGTGSGGSTAIGPQGDSPAAGVGIEAVTRGLEASVRRAGFAAQRLDLAHDTAFAAAVLPLGRSIGRGTA